LGFAGPFGITGTVYVDGLARWIINARSRTSNASLISLDLYEDSPNFS
jgi:hypothetical protein